MQRSWEVRQSKREQTATWPYVACHLKIADREGNRERADREGNRERGQIEKEIKREQIEKESEKDDNKRD